MFGFAAVCCFLALLRLNDLGLKNAKRKSADMWVRLRHLCAPFCHVKILTPKSVLSTKIINDGYLVEQPCRNNDLELLARKVIQYQG